MRVSEAWCTSFVRDNASPLVRRLGCARTWPRHRACIAFLQVLPLERVRPKRDRACPARRNHNREASIIKHLIAVLGLAGAVAPTAANAQAPSVIDTIRQRGMVSCGV